VIYPNGRRALKHAELEVAAGEFVVLLGPSGAGKSTLLRSLNGLVPLSEGTLEAEGLGVVRGATAMRALRKRTGMVFQQHQLIGRLSALANVLTGRLGHHSALRSLLPAPRADKLLALHALERVGLLDRALNRVDQFSVGEQQRIGVARALAQQPRLMLADEPVASLDPATAVHVLALIHSICKADGIAAVVSLHQVSLARRFADRMVALASGALVFEGRPDELDAATLTKIYGAGLNGHEPEEFHEPEAFQETGGIAVRRRDFLGLIVALAVAAPAEAADPPKLRVALLPDENAATIIQNAQPLKAYLEKALGKDIELVVTTDYSSMIEAMRFNRIEIAYFGPLSYVLAKSKSEIEAFAAGVSKGRPTYTSVVIVGAGADVKSIADLKGKTVAYGDQASTSSHLVPRAMLQDKGLVADQDYKAVYLGQHDAVARAVESGKVPAGALSRPIFESLLKTGKVDGAKVRILAETDPIPNYPMAMQSSLSPELKSAIRKAFLDLKDPAILKSFRAEGFAPMTDADYDVLRVTAKVLNLDLAKLQ